MQRAFVVMPLYNPSNYRYNASRVGAGQTVEGKFPETLNSHYNASDFNPSDSVSDGGIGDTFLGHLWNFVTGRSAQQQLQSNQQQFDEYMYRMYNSPEALVRQFNEAGINTNLIGSTSFGTASSAAGAPAVNGSQNPIGDLANVAESVASAASLAADPALKASQAMVNMSLPDLNHALTTKYGAEAALTDIQFQSTNQLLEWSRQDRECNAMSLRLGYFQALQNYRNSRIEMENLIKEGKVLDSEASWTDWKSKIEQETYDILIKHHYLPDADYLTRFFTDYVENGNNAGFNKFMNAFTWMEDNRNRSTARFGVNGGSLKIGPVTLDSSMIEYLIQSGVDLVDFVHDIDSGSNKTGLMNWFNGLFKGDSDKSESNPKPNSKSSSDVSNNVHDAVAKAVTYGRVDRNTMIDMLVADGFSASWVHDHILDIEDGIRDMQK